MAKRIPAILLLLGTLASVCTFGASAADEELLSKGKSYTVEYTAKIENAYPNMAYSAESKLTDGLTGAATYSDANWLSLYRGQSAVITIDLESVCSVSRVNVGMLQQKSSGVECARYINVYVSEDGTNYGTAAEYSDPRSITLAGSLRIPYDIALNGTYKARYVRLVISSYVNTYIDEISVYGSADASGASSAPAYTEPEDVGFAQEIDGISSICLMYTASNYTKDMIKPYVAYTDAEGNASDTMFDSLLFLAMPSTSCEDGFMRQSDMTAFVKSALSNGTEHNIDALDAVIGELKSELSLGDDYKYPIFISTPFVGQFDDAFGEIDGKTVTASDYESRLKIIKWYVDYVTSEFASCNFENIELKGLYWFKEDVSYTLSTYEEELIKGFNDYCHEKELKTIWIPYYCAAGFDRARELGFDAATLQSGYAFDNSSIGKSKAESVNDSAAAAKKFGLGMEFEVDSGVSDYYKRFSQYVHVAYSEGLPDGGIMMMYQVGTVLWSSAMSKSASGRQVYELTYKYCSKTYKECAPVIADDQTITVRQGEYTRGKLTITDDDTNTSSLYVAEIEKPEGVYVLIEGNGFFEVDAALSEPGTYYATFSVTDGYNVSNTARVTIIVEPGEASEASEASEAGQSTDEGGQSSNNNSLYYIIAAAAGLAIAAAAVIIIIKKKKKNQQ